MASSSDGRFGQTDMTKTGLQQLLDKRDAVIDATAAKASNGETTDADKPSRLSDEVVDAIMDHRDLLAWYKQQIPRIREVGMLNIDNRAKNMTREEEERQAKLRKTLEKFEQNKLQKEKKLQTEQQEKEKKRKREVSPVREPIRKSAKSRTESLREVYGDKKAAFQEAAPRPPTLKEKKTLEEMYSSRTDAAQGDTAGLGTGRGGRGENAIQGAVRGENAGQGAGRDEMLIAAAENSRKAEVKALRKKLMDSESALNEVRHENEELREDNKQLTRLVIDFGKWGLQLAEQQRNFLEAVDSRSGGI